MTSGHLCNSLRAVLGGLLYQQRDPRTQYRQPTPLLLEYDQDNKLFHDGQCMALCRKLFGFYADKAAA